MKVSDKTYIVKATILKVIDGDTFHARAEGLFEAEHKLTFRMMGIDAPEIHSKNEVQKTLALESKDWLIREIEGKQVWLRTYKVKEKYGRYLADVFTTDPNVTESESVNVTMISKRLAKAYFGGKKDEEV